MASTRPDPVFDQPAPAAHIAVFDRLSGGRPYCYTYLDGAMKRHTAVKFAMRWKSFFESEGWITQFGGRAATDKGTLVEIAFAGTSESTDIREVGVRLGPRIRSKSLLQGVEVGDAVLMIAASPGVFKLTAVPASALPST